MTHRPLSLVVIFGAVALALGSCKTDTASRSSQKDVQPIPAKTVALMTEKGMRKEDPILVRIYKEDSKLEVWKKRAQDGRYAHLKTYEICRWSGNLGPKKAEGDRQAPEGFYSVTPGQMNPKSAYYLSFDTGFPNAYDKSLGRSGRNLMVHGDCLSAGCYAMTDPQIAEVYALAREAFRGGQKSFQLQAMPFRMTAENMARRRTDPNMAFWKNLKEGADHFEVTKLEPKVNVCGQKYVFDANAKDGGTFDPNAQCPSFEVEPTIAVAAAAKAKQDQQKFADLVAQGVQVAEAYVPQNGRVRRSLGEPVSQSVMMAEAAPVAVPPMTSAPQNSGTLLAMAGAPAPMHSPSPYASAAPKSTHQGIRNLLAWNRQDTPSEPDTSRTPTAGAGLETPATRVESPVQVAAVASPTIELSRTPVTASFGAGAPNYKPLYRRMLGFAGGDEKPAATASAGVAVPVAPISAPAPAPVSTPALRAGSVPAPRPAVAKPAQAAAVKQAPVSPPAPPPQTASAAPQLPQTGMGLMSAAPILGTGAFTR